MFDKLRAFMAGRNGFDGAAIALIAIAFALNMISRIIGRLPLVIVSMAFLALALIRILSKNVAKRRAENYKFIRISRDLGEEFRAWRARRSESKLYKFYSCPDCKSRLRVRRGAGKIKITCPKCGLRFIRRS